jgi:flagellar protein FlbD
MIQLKRINHVPVVLNSDLIEHIETTPDTVVSLTNGHKILVLDSPDEIIERVVQFRRAVIAQPFSVSRRTSAENAYPVGVFHRPDDISERKTGKDD